MVNDGIVRTLAAGRRVQARFALGLAASLCLLGAVTTRSLAAGQQESTPDGARSKTQLEDEIRAMREEIHALRQEVDGLRQDLRGTWAERGTTGTLRPEVIAVSKVEQPEANAQQRYAQPSRAPSAPLQVSDQQGPELAGTVSMLQSQVAEQAQTKVESNSKMPIKVFGTVLSSTFFNTRAVDWADVPSVVQWAKAVPSATGSLSSSLRQSRVGLIVDGPSIGSMRAGGYFAVDFMGGSSDFQSGPLFGLPHMVYGYMRFEGAKTAMEAGQDELILASRHPTSLVTMSYPELFRSGDLYDRAPQVRVERELASTKQGSLRMTVGLVAPVGNYPGLDFPGAGLAEAWQRPAVQGRLAWRSAEATSDTNQEFQLGLSAHYGRVRLGVFSAASWAGEFDFDAHRGRLGLDGEWYLGQNLQSFGGGIGQPGKTLGGYVEGRLTATPRLQFNGGFGSDHLTKFDIIPVGLNRNTGIFANTIFQFTPEVGASFEYRHLTTRPFAGALRNNSHLDVGIAYSF